MDLGADSDKLSDIQSVDNNKRTHQFVDISDSDEDFLPKRPVSKLRRVDSNEFKSGTLDKYFKPGTSVSVSGFKSVCNKTSSVKDRRADSLAADRNQRAHKLDSSSESDTEVGEEEPLVSVLRKKPTNNQENSVSRNITCSISSESRQNVGSESQQRESEPMAECPVCGTKVPQQGINAHLDSCLS